MMAPQVERKGSLQRFCQQVRGRRCCGGRCLLPLAALLLSTLPATCPRRWPPLRPARPLACPPCSAAASTSSTGSTPACAPAASSWRGTRSGGAARAPPPRAPPPPPPTPVRAAGGFAGAHQALSRRPFCSRARRVSDNRAASRLTYLPARPHPTHPAGASLGGYVPRPVTKRQLSALEAGAAAPPAAKSARPSPDRDPAGSGGSSASEHSAHPGPHGPGLEAMDVLAAAAEEEGAQPSPPAAAAAAARAPALLPDPSWFAPAPPASQDGQQASSDAAGMTGAYASLGLGQEQPSVATLPRPLSSALVVQLPAAPQQPDLQLLLANLVAPPLPLAAAALPGPAAQQLLLQQQLAALGAAAAPVPADPLALASALTAAQLARQQAAAAALATEAQLRRLLLEQEHVAAAAQEAQAAGLFAAAAQRILASILAPGAPGAQPAEPAAKRAASAAAPDTRSSTPVAS